MGAQCRPAGQRFCLVCRGERLFGLHLKDPGACGGVQTKNCGSDDRVWLRFVGFNEPLAAGCICLFLFIVVMFGCTEGAR